MTMLGLKHSEATKQKIRQANKNNPRFKDMHKGDRAYNYKGDKVSYAGLHMWVSRWKGKPNFCEICKSKDAKRYEWANKSGEYKRDLNDWMRLCKKCHFANDDVGRKMWLTRKGV